MAKDKKPDRAALIATRVYSRHKAERLPIKGLFVAVRKRARELIAEVEDEDQVELVILHIAERDGAEFEAYRSLAWTSYEYFRSKLSVANGAWKPALMSYLLPEGTDLRESLDYWLGQLYDWQEIGDMKMQSDCLHALTGLTLRAEVMLAEDPSG